MESKFGGTGPIDHAQNRKDSLATHVVLCSCSEETAKQFVGRVVDILQRRGEWGGTGTAGSQKRREEVQAGAAHGKYFRRRGRVMTRFTESRQYCL